MSNPQSTAHFVGRAPELARLSGFLDQATSGVGQTCFVTGEPGAGKSSLLSEFVRTAGQRHPELVIAEGDCNPQTGTGDAYLPFREVMTQLSAGKQNDNSGGDSDKESGFLAFAGRLVLEHGPDLIDLFVPGAALLTRVSGEAADRLRRRRDAARMAELEAVVAGGLGQAQIMEQFTNVIHAMAERNPLLLVVDDLHWADESSVNLLFHLARRIKGHRVLLAGAFRASEVTSGRDGARHPLASPLNELKRYEGDIEIALPIGQAEASREFLDQLLDAEANELGESFREELFRRTGGHALFTVELLHHLQQQGAIRRNADGAWEAVRGMTWDGLPARVEGVIREKAARLETGEFDLLSSASVLGESFDVELLAGMVERNSRDVARELSGALSRQHALVRARGVRFLGGQRLSEYEFRHNLVHEYFYGSLDDVERSLLHEAAACALEAQYGKDCGEVAVHLGRHFSLANIPDRAAQYLLMAGNEARRSFAHREARTHMQQAIAMVDSVEAMKLREPEWISRTHREALEQLGEVMIMQGDFEDARHCFESALNLDESDSLVRVRILSNIATSHEREHHHEKALIVLAEALESLDSSGLGDEPQGTNAWINIQIQKLRLYYWMGEIEGMENAIAQAESRIAQYGSPSQKQRFLAGIAKLGMRKDCFLPSASTVDAAEKALALALQSESIHEQAEGRFESAFIFLLTGDFERARQHMKAALEQSTKCGNRTLEARALTYLAILHRRLGDRGNTLEYCDRAQRLSEELGMREYVAAALACRSWLAWLDGNSDSATELSNRALEEWRQHAPRFPFKWLALVQQLDIALSKETEPEESLNVAAALMETGNARLDDGVSELLEAAVAVGKETDPGAARANLSQAVSQARIAGYL